MTRIEEAHIVLHREYFASVRQLAGSFVRRLHRGDFLDANHTRAAIKEEAAVSVWAQTTGAAYQALLLSDNEACLQTEMKADVRARASSFDELVKLAATIVFRLDVLDELEGTLGPELETLDEWFAARTTTHDLEPTVDDVPDDAAG